MKRLKDVLGDVAKFVDNGVSLCLQLKKRGGVRKGKGTMAVDVISVGKGHIMARLKSNHKVVSIDVETNVSRLKTGSVSLIY